MGIPQSRQGKRAAVLSWVALVILIPAVLYVSYVMEQLHQVTRQNLRTLDTAAGRIEAVLETARKNARNLAGELEFACQFLDRQPRLRLVKPDSCKKLPKRRFPEDVKIKLEPHGLELLLSGPWDRGDGDAQRKPAKPIEDAVRRDEDGATAPPTEAPKPAPQDTDAGTRDAEDQRPMFKLSVDLDEILKELPFDRSFDHLLIANAAGNIVVQNGVHLTSGAGGLRVKNLSELTLPEGNKVDLDSLQGSTGLLDVRLAEEDYQLLCQPLRLPIEDASADADAQAADHATWLICGLVLHESSVRRALAVSPTLILILIVLVVSGLLSWPLFKLFAMARRERLRFADVFFLSVSTFAMLMLCTILLVDADSTWRLRDASIDSLEDLAIQVEENLRTELEALYGQLDAYDKDLSGEFEQHLMWRNILNQNNCPAKDQIGAFRDVHLLDPWQVEGPERRSLGARSCGDPPPEIFSHPKDQQGFSLYPNSQMFSSASKSRIFFPAPEEHVHFTSVFWMCPKDGMQFIKGTIWGQNTPAVKLKERAYFAAVDEERLWRVDSRMRFFVQSFFSLTTGERHAALSMESGLHLDPNEPMTAYLTGECEFKKGKVAAAISGALVSVTDPVLAPGYGFAIIEAGGRILFHSDNRRILEENLFQEVREGDRLRAAVLSGTERTFSSHYLSRSHQLYVRPMRDVPWSIVTFVDEELLRTAHIEALAHTIIFAVGYLSLYFLFFVVYRLNTGRHTPWLWPDPQKKLLYQHLTVLFGSLLVLFAIGFLLLPAWGCLLLCLILPVTGVVLVCSRFRYDAWWTERVPSATAVVDRLPPILRRPLRWLPAALRWLPVVRQWRDPGFLGWHYVSAVLLWFLVAVFPAYGFYKVAFEKQQRLLVKVENLHVARRLEEHACTIRDTYRRITQDPQPAAPANFIDKRLSLKAVAVRDVYWSSLFAPSSEGVPHERVTYDCMEPGDRSDPRCALPQDEGESAVGFFAGILTHGRRFLARYKPLYNANSIRMRYLEANAADDGEWQWQDEEGQILFTHSDGICRRGFGLCSALPLGSPRLGWWTWIGGLLATLVLLAWVRHSARHLYFARIEGQLELVHAERLIDGRIAGNVIALVISPHDQEKILNSPHYERIRLDPAGLKGEEAEEAAGGDPGKPVVCSGFEDGLGDAEIRLEKLRRLEALAADRRVLIVTSLDPFEKLGCLESSLSGQEEAKEPSEGLPTPPDKEEVRRWDRLLSRFVLMPVAIKDGKEPPEVPGIRRREALERILDTAGGYYRWLWTSCSDDEKLVLVHLAEEGFVNPKQHRVVRRLLQRGLLVRDPVLRLMSPAFALFVDRTHAPEEVARWEEPIGGLGWTHLRWALLALLAVVVLFLSTTQRQLLETTLGFASALALGVPGILKLISTLHGGGSDDIDRMS